MNMLREHSVSDCLRTIFRVYISHFRVLFLVGAMPNLALFWLWIQLDLAADTSFDRWESLLEFVDLVVAGAATVTVSDICLGNRAGLFRSYGRLSRVRGALVWTSLLIAALSFFPLVLLAVSPGEPWDLVMALLADLLALLVQTVLALGIAVVVLERKNGFGAVVRSYRLSRGFIWRNLLVLGLVAAAVWGSGQVATAALLAIGENTVVDLTLLAVLSTPFPLLHIATVVLYYDCRVRKEGLTLDELSRMAAE